MMVCKFVLDKPFEYKSEQRPDINSQFGSSRIFTDDDATVWLKIDSDGTILIYDGYAWDGCSPKFKLGNLVIGTPDGSIDPRTGKPRTYYASLVHDALYQFLDDPIFPFTREQCDLIFLELLTQADFSLAGLYYRAVRHYGHIYRRLDAVWRRWS